MFDSSEFGLVVSGIKYMTVIISPVFVIKGIFKKVKGKIEEVINALNTTMSYKIMNICMMFV